MSVTGIGGSVGGFNRFRTPFSTRSGVRYPSPFFDIGSTFLPSNFKQLMRWCRYYFLVHPLINAVVFKMAEYAITPLIVKTQDNKLLGDYTTLIEDVLKLRPFSIEVGLDYYAYGNCFVSVYYPFKKYLVCKQCGSHWDIKDTRSGMKYDFRNLKYHIKGCPKCGHAGEAGVLDHHVPSVREIRLVRWDPEHVDIEYCPTTGEHRYYYRLPLQLKNDITIGKREVIETVPDIYIEAMRKGKSVLFNPDNLFHMKRPTIAQKDMGWGMPMILPVLKDAYYMQILRKGQEAIAQEHIVPLRVLFPQAGSGTSDPYTTINLDEWTHRIEGEISKWKLDPNYIPVLPLPIGHQIIGGNGRAMILHQELRMEAETIIAGMGVPQEFIFGGLQYSGSNVSMRMLENHFLGYRHSLLHLVRDFVLHKVANFLGWAKVDVEFRRFKMADDLQRLFFFQQLNQAGKVSDRTLLIEADLDPQVEQTYLDSELAKSIETQRRTQVGSAAVQGEAQLVNMRYTNRAQAEGMKAQMLAQAEAQREMETGTAAPPPPEPQPAPTEAPGALPGESQLTVASRGGGIDLMTEARRAVSYLNQVAQSDPEEANRMVKFMRQRNPQMFSLVARILQEQRGGNENPLDARQQPMPEQRPPRRAAMG